MSSLVAFVGSTAARRSYFSFPPGRRSIHGSPLWWVKPAAYAAGGAALVVVAWPVLRFVVIGGLAYGAYRLVRLWLILRDLNRSSSGGSSVNNPLEWLFGSIFSQGGVVSGKGVRTMQKIGEASLTAACSGNNSDRDVIGLFERALGLEELYDITLGEPMETQSSAVMVDGVQRHYADAVFPVYVSDSATTLFVQVSAVSGDAQGETSISVESMRLLARMPSGEVAETSIRVVGSDDSLNDDPDSFSSEAREHKRKVQDAEYKDL
ncbi:hypothetical protein LPJ53_004690 [Coemansia erecta]|uniref:Uncharacterized protein n=1 Tax=Coemansia erecta TaxID=147472 RepID=A0A9W7XWM7_9FUNG|nr:hypothetical protein LPJ53_004690 [Coemansia erecta]